MTNNPSRKQIYNRRSIRLKGYDYSKAGAYFITICVKDKIHFFWKIENGEMVLNDAGKMIDKWWQKIPEKFPDIELGEYQIMPNHFQAIVINTGIVGADPRVRPENKSSNNDFVRADPFVRPENDSSGSILGQTHGSAHTNTSEHILGEHTAPILGEHTAPILGEHTAPILGEHTGSPLRAVVQWFKTMSTNEYIRGVKLLNWQAFDGKLWHRNYYEHIIRNEKSYNAIANYINNNPANWENDNFYLK